MPRLRAALEAARAHPKKVGARKVVRALEQALATFGEKRSTDPATDPSTTGEERVSRD
ncbi:MAG: hypothetical protein AAF797_18085 [Planctomycetota bacterium]